MKLLKISDFIESYQSKRFTPLDVAENIINKIKSDKNNIFISIDEKLLIKQAKESTVRYNKPSKHLVNQRLLDGVPISWKDLFNIKGQVTTAGSPTKINNIVQNTSPIVHLMNQSGALFAGKTNLTEFVFSGLGLNPYFGNCTIQDNNKQLHAPGGSSSGAALSITNNFVPVAFGTDTAGSIRIPAAFNGLIGFRPSLNRYSTQYVFPLSSLCDTVGILASNVDDVILIDNIITSLNLLFNNKNFDIKQTKNIVIDTYVLNNYNIEKDVYNNFYKTINKLSNNGFNIIEYNFSVFNLIDDFNHQYGWAPGYEAYLFHKTLLHGESSSLIDPLVYKRLINAKNYIPDIINKFVEKRKEMQKKLQQDLNLLNSEFILMPTVSITSPFMHELDTEKKFFTKNLEVLKITMLASFLDMPSISIPMGLSQNGLHTGIQISSISQNDANVLKVAKEIEFILNNNQ